MYTFLCYSTADKSNARKLYNRLSAYAWLSVWFEFGGQENVEEVVENANAVILFLSQESVSRRGFEEEIYTRTIEQIKAKEKQREVNASERRSPFIVIPIRLNECTIPEHLQFLSWKDYFIANTHEEIINSLVSLSLLKQPAVYAIEGKVTIKDSTLLLAEKPAEVYENLDWCGYVRIPVSKETNYSFIIRKFQITNEQYLHFLQSDDYADKQFWVNFPKYDHNCKYIGDWGNDGFDWLKKHLKLYPSLFEMRRNWVWYFPNINLRYDFRQPKHPADVTWFEANAYCKWVSAHWQELPEAKSLLDLIGSNKKLNFRLPLETEIHAALTHDDGTRVRVDPTGRKRINYPGLPPGIPLDFPDKDMLANLYGENSKGNLAYCWGIFFIDQVSRDNYRLWDRGSNSPSDGHAFRMVVTEQQETR